MKRDIFKKRINYKPFEYPEVIKFIEAIHNTFWTHTEIDFTADKQDYLVNISDVEKEVIKRSLLAIAQIEVGVKTFWGDLYKHFPKPELNGLGATFSSNEWIHSQAYSHLLEVLGFNNEFENIYTIPVFKDKLDLISDSLTDKKDILEKLLFFTIVIENSSLFSQFANILSFTRFKGLLKNTSNIIQWTSIDEQCFLPNTEIMTPNGWVKIQDFKVGDEVFGYKEGVISKEQVLKTIKSTSNTIIKLGNNQNYTFLTPDHEVIIYNKHKGCWEKKLAKHHPRNSYSSYPINGKYTSENNNVLSNYERILIVLQTNGSKNYCYNKNGEKLERGKNGVYNCSINLYKKRKIDRFRELIKNTNIKYTETIINESGNKTEGVCFRLHIEKNINFKTFSWIDLTKVSKVWCEQFIEELINWNGYKNGSHTGYYSINKEDIDIVNIIAVLAGYNTIIYKNKNSEKKGTLNDCYKISFKDKDKIVSTCTSIKKEFLPYNGNVYCITVPSGGLITRYNNKLFITGNCHSEAGIMLINIIKEEQPKYFEDMSKHIIKDVHKYIQYESKLLDWIFEKGELEFYTKKNLLDFMKYRIDEALVRIGLEKQFNITKEEYKPMAWFDEEIKVQQMSDFFAVRPTDYSKHNQVYSKDNLF